MKFEREHYIEKLLSSKHNHLIKIVTLCSQHRIKETVNIGSRDKEKV